MLYIGVLVHFIIIIILIDTNCNHREVICTVSAVGYSGDVDISITTLTEVITSRENLWRESYRRPIMSTSMPDSASFPGEKLETLTSLCNRIKCHFRPRVSDRHLDHRRHFATADDIRIRSIIWLLFVNHVIPLVPIFLFSWGLIDKASLVLMFWAICVCLCVFIFVV